MSTEHRDLPTGYTIRELPGINVSLPMPDSWFYLGIVIPSSPTVRVLGTHVFQLSRESIPKRGIFNTGVTVYGFTDFSRNVGRSSDKSSSPISFAQSFLRSLPLIQPVGEITETNNGSLAVFKRRYILPVERFMTIPSFHGELVSKMMPPTHFSYVAAGNDETDTAYLAWFETPSVKWREDRTIAETMLNGITFPRST